MALADPFSTTYQGSQQGLGTLGQALQAIAQLQYQKKVKQQEMLNQFLLQAKLQEMEQAGKERLTEKEYQLKQQFPDPITALLMERFGVGGGIQAPGIKSPGENYIEQYSEAPPGGMPSVGLTFKPTGFAFSPEDEARLDIWKTKEKEKISSAGEAEKKKTELLSDINKSKIVSQYNFDLVAGNLRDYAEILADAYDEGGAGDIYKAGISGLVEGGFIPSEFGLSSKYPRTAALKGKHFEVVGKMFPMISQQIGKEGSVRLIESIFSKLGETIPQKKTPPANAPEMMKTSVQSFYRVRRAFDAIDLKNYDLKTQDGLENLASDIATKAQQIEISGEEKEALNKLSNFIVEPLEKRLSGNVNKSISNNVQSEIDEIDRQLQELGGL